MAHPYAGHKEVHAGRKRAGSMAKFKKGGAVHSDEAEDKKLIKKMVKKDDLKVEGRSTGGRLDKYARGGRTKKGGGKTHINILVAPQGGKADAAAPPGPGLPPGAGGPPPGMKPPMGPPPGAGGPPGLPPGMMNRGGGVKKYAKGGKVPMKAGAMTGEGRKEKAKAYGGKPLPKG